MLQTIIAFPHIVAMHAFLAYAILALGIIIEGEVFVIVGGILAHLGALSFSGVILVVILGALLKTFICYGIGNILFKFFPHSPLLKVIQRRIQYIFPRFNERPFWSMFIARFFVLGAHTVTLVFAGYNKTSFKKIVLAEICSVIPWSVGFTALGFFFSHSALAVTHDIRKFLIIILLSLVGFLIVEKIINSTIESFSIK